MKRIYEEVILDHIKNYRQMLFIMGPRQVGKTTTCYQAGQLWANFFYFNWDREEDRELILKGANSIALKTDLNKLTVRNALIIFDEIHKYKKWKLFLKGFYDSFPNKSHIIATGSAKLNVYRRGGDSLMGRYFPFRFHPLSVAEIVYPEIGVTEIRPLPKEIADYDFEKLWQFGGYPDPFINGTARFYNRWKNLRLEKLFKEDIRDLTRVQELDQLQTMATILQSQIGQNTTYDSLAKKVRVSANTIRSWFAILNSIYYCFELRPWCKNVTRSLLKEPKYYLWDWSLCTDNGSRAENFVALHLLKAVNFWTDYGFGEYDLHYLRDKEQREVDFVITKNKKPWILVEVKLSDQTLSPALSYFQNMLQAEYAFQVVLEMPYVQRNCFEAQSAPLVVPAKTFLSQLV